MIKMIKILKASDDIQFELIQVQREYKDVYYNIKLKIIYGYNRRMII